MMSEGGEIERTDEDVGGPASRGEGGGDGGRGESAPQAPSAEEMDRLARAASERDDYLEKLQRTAADFANYQKRIERERSQERRFGIQDFVTEVLSVLDNLSRAVASAEETARESDSLLEGVKLVERQFEKILRDNGVVPIEAGGKTFDPSLHEAVAREEREDVPDKTIVDVVRRGYRLHDRVIRPAQVRIAMRPEGAGEDEDDGTPD